VNLVVVGDEGKDRRVVVAVGGAGEASPAPRVQVGLAHEAADLLGVDDMAAMTKLGANAAVAVALEGVGDRPHLRDDLLVGRLGLRRR
jgi:hypothetical protein